MERPEPYRGWKRYAAAALRVMLRTYVRYAPWDAFKAAAYRMFERYVAWQPHSAVTRTQYGFRMRTQITDLLSCAIYLTGRWEPFLTTYIRSRLRPGDVFVDVGANIGYYSLLASRLVGSSGRVYSIEASTSNHAALLENIGLNHRNNIVAINAAAAATAGEVVIWQADERNLGHNTTVATLATAEGMKPEASVRGDTVDQLVGPDVFRRARIVKVDVEGAERSVLTPLLGCPTALGDDTEWLIELTPDYLQHGQRDAEWIFNSFTALGYTAYVVPNSYSVSGYLARARTVTLSRVTEAPAHQADVLFRREPPRAGRLG
ncbi:MAG TPA: FkbM family methyltransferase [Steroidobacteraceae bacterium]|nr:FkbM family methyltransferase [Steroidobacteraceae bacterium]